MADQADKLRALRLIQKRSDQSGEVPPSPGRPRMFTVAVTGGKGGVGKSVLVTNLAMACARVGRRVLVVDADLSLANVDLLLGMIPKANLSDVVFGSHRIEDVVIDTPYGFRFLPAASGLEEMATLDDFRRERLIRELSRLEDTCDLMIIDTATGVGRQTTHFVSIADRVLILATPEPTAFSDAYATLKVLAMRPDPDRLGLVINRTDSVGQGTRTAKRISAVAKRFLGFEPECFGVIPEDEAVGQSVMRQEPLLSMYPHSSASDAIVSLAAEVLREPEPHGPLSVDPDGVFKKVVNFES